MVRSLVRLALVAPLVSASFLLAFYLMPTQTTTAAPGGS